MNIPRFKVFLLMLSLVGCSKTNFSEAPQSTSKPLALEAVSERSGLHVKEVSTEELQQILEDGSALVLDTRPHLEWSISHIPGALNVAPKPGVPMALYTSDVAEVGRLIDGDKAKPLVLYCNGPYCGKSKRVAGDLLDAGYASVRRYQLGTPMWRALDGVMVIEADGVQYVFDHDQTAVWIDVRDATEFHDGSISRARNIPHSAVLPGKDVGEVFAAKNDGRLPMEDHNTRIIVFGNNNEQAIKVAEALVREAFHNVTYFSGSYAEIKALIE